MQLKRQLFTYPRIFCALLMLAGAAATAQEPYVSSRVTPPQVMREYRAAWVASVGNIDWPSQKGLSSADQKAELVAMMDKAVDLKLNTLILQVRPACDALYASSLEPWSEYLTGTMGKAPEPFYDPLSFAVEEAHKRGLELHAWFNPYRAGHPSAKSTPSPNHISRTHPELVRHYGKQLWLDPGEKEVQDYSHRVVMDVVRRYDVDGVHFDDYFYPYKEKDAAGRELDFPDNASWAKYGAASRLTRDDWRRENVNGLIERVYKSIKATKPWVKFGVSPFGIWRPENPPQIRGFDAYDKLYADSRKWLRNGWVDYFVPQLYWSIEGKEQSFPVLLKWWADQNPKGRHLLPGLDDTKTLNKWKPDEIINQIGLTRKQHGTSGEVHWNMKSVMRNPALEQALKRGPYNEPALVPTSSWLDSSKPNKPRVSVQRSGEKTLKVSWSCEGEEKPWTWILQWRSEGIWKTQVLPRSKAAANLNDADILAVTAVDRNGNASPPCVLEKKG